MRIDFTTEVRDPDFGFSLNETDFQIEAELSSLHDGKYIVDVTQVWLDGVDLLASRSPLAQSVASIVTTAAESSRYVLAALEDEAAEEFAERQMRRIA
jgi:predicted dinucleotide-binding enzyme